MKVGKPKNLGYIWIVLSKIGDITDIKNPLRTVEDGTFFKVGDTCQVRDGFKRGDPTPRGCLEIVSTYLTFLLRFYHSIFLIKRYIGI